MSATTETPGTIFGRSFDIDTEWFRYLRLEVRSDPQTGGQLVRHEIEAHGPTPRAYIMFAHFRPDRVNSIRRNFPAMSHDTPDSRRWKPGQRMEIVQPMRLPAGSYSVFVGFLTGGGQERMPLDGPQHLLALGDVEIEVPPDNTLQRTPDLAPANMPTLLEDILALKPLAGQQQDHLTHCFSQAPEFGHILEFGVAGGKSITHLAELVPHRRAWGFDTFEGLPEDWARSDTRAIGRGAFTQGGALPPVPHNVTLVKGLIQDTLPPWLAENAGNAAFVHVDVDLYSAASFVLNAMNERIVPGTVIVFDDVAVWHALEAGHSGPYEKWREGEWKALNEWAEQHRRQFAVISRLRSSVLGLRVLE